MFRLVVIPQLVLSMLVGPMLCCCTAARLGHDASPNSRTTASADQSQRKQCCGQRSKPTDAGQSKPGDEEHGDHEKCPCKDAPAKIAVSASLAGSVDSIGLLLAGMLTLDSPYPMVALSDATLASTRFDSRSSSPLTADLFFAYHRLRC
jgi:hypothetical protein